MSRNETPKGLRVFSQERGSTCRVTIEEAAPVDTYAPCAYVGGTGFLDADQLDKLAERCKQWSKYLRSQKGKKPVVKKWEDL